MRGARWTAFEEQLLREHSDLHTRELVVLLEEKTGTTRTVAAIKERFVKLKISRPRKKPNICIECRRALPKKVDGIACSWAMGFQPVEGWDATKTIIEPKNIESYAIRHCPLFIRG